MKLLFTAHPLLIDCGKASKQTKGVLSAAFWEGGVAPTNRRVQ
jgi:hypothetical protein